MSGSVPGSSYRTRQVRTQVSRRVAECVHAHEARKRRLGMGRRGDVAVLAVDAAHVLEHRSGRRPHGGGSSLLGRLESLAHIAVLVHPSQRDHFLAPHVALQRGHDAAGMHGERTHRLCGTNGIQVHRANRLFAVLD